MQIKPGLSAYANNPQSAADSLIDLLDKAQNVVPKELRPSTPVRVGVSIYIILHSSLCEFKHFQLSKINLDFDYNSGNCGLEGLARRHL